MNQYLYIIKSPRGDFVNSITPEESAIMTEHYQYLISLKEQGNVLLAGRTQEEESIGLIVFEAEDDDHAQAIVDADPSVQAGVMNATLHPYRVAIMQGRD